MFKKINRIPKFLIKKYSIEGEKIKTIISKKTEGGKNIIEKINIVETWKKLSKTQKNILISYLSVSAISFMFSTYSDGKEALLNYRNNKGSSSTSELQAVRYGCNKNILGNFCNGIFFPYTMFSNVLPYIILKLN